MIESLLTQYLTTYDLMKGGKWRQVGKKTFQETREYRDSFLEQSHKEIKDMGLSELVDTLFVIYQLNRTCEIMGFSVKSGIAIMRLKTKVMDRTLKLFNQADTQTQNEIRERLKEISIHMP